MFLSVSSRQNEAEKRIYTVKARIQRHGSVLSSTFDLIYMANSSLWNKSENLGWPL